MIKQVEVIRRYGVTDSNLVLNLRESGAAEGLTIFKIDGLGPPKATVSGGQSRYVDGMTYPTVRATERRIVLTLAVTPGYDEQAAKLKIYTHFMIKRPIRLKFVMDSGGSAYTYVISGIVEDVDFKQFNRIENADITIVCANPYFRVYTETEGVENPNSWDTILEYTTTNYLSYPTQAANFPMPTGIYMNIELTGHVGTMTIVNSLISTNSELNSILPYGATTQVMTIDFDKSAVGVCGAGDVVSISTVVGNKFAYLQRGGNSYSLIGGIGIDDHWITLIPWAVRNDLSWSATSGEDNVKIGGITPGFRIYYDEVCQGI